jgi:hypothetical protein
MAASSAANYENGITRPPLPPAGEGWGEGGYDFSPSLCHWVTHPVLSDLYKAERDFYLSPWGEERASVYFLGRYEVRDEG